MSAPPPPVPDSLAGYKAAVSTLVSEAKAAKRTAWTIGAVGLVALSLAAGLGWLATQHGTEVLANAKDYRREALIFELVRAAATAALLGAFVWGMLNLARAALDQATRYQKRLIAGHFLQYVLTLFESEIKDGSIKLTDVMSIFSAWNDSVESAFTNVKFGSKKGMPISVAASKDGVAFASGGGQALEIPGTSAEAGTKKPR